MTREGATRAAWAGLATLVFFGASLVVFVLSQLTGVNPIFGGGQPTTVTYLGTFLAAPAVAAFGGALPGRALGAAWLASLLASGTWVAFFFWAAFGPKSPVLMTAAAAMGPVLVTLVGATGGGMVRAGLRKLLTASALFLATDFLVLLLLGGAAIFLVLPVWVVLPALAGAFQTHGTDESLSGRR